MAKVNVTTKFAINDLIDRFVDDRFGKQLGDEITRIAKEEIAEGLSPVRSKGRFARYKDRKKYPGERKSARPVNLYLTGEMLAGLGSKMKNATTIVFGMLSGSQHAKAKAQAHNEGTAAMARRQFIPQAGEEFSIRIMRAIRELYQKRLTELLKASNKKSSKK